MGRAERMWIAASLSLYVAMLIFVIPRHEPWADEAQAWELAKSLGLTSLFGTYIHYEASPGLWHALLWLLATLHTSYAGMHWVAAAIAVFTMAIMLIEAPFPLGLRLLLPFTYFFAFQYSVVARNYVLFPAILFTLAALWHRRHDRLWPVAILTGLLANVSAHGLAVALGLSIVLLIEEIGERRNITLRWKSLVAPAAVLAVLLAFAGGCMLPAPQAGWVIAARSLQSHAGLESSIEGLRSNHPWVNHLSFRGQIYLNIFVQFARLLCLGLGGNLLLGFVMWALLLYTWRQKRLVRYVLPVALLTFPWPIRYFTFYHAGLTWVLLLFLVWITWPQISEATMNRNQVWARGLLLGCLALCCLIQVKWSIDAIRYDVAMPYSPDRDGAILLGDYLAQGWQVVLAVPLAKSLSASSQYFATGLEPYFDKQPIGDMPFRFWYWGGNGGMRAKYLAASSAHSAVVLVEETSWDNRYITEEARLVRIGYKRDRVVCGQVFYPLGMSSSTLCHAFYRP